MLRKKYFILVNDKDEPIGIDRASGGYPFVANQLHFISTWEVEEPARMYADVFKNSTSYGAPFHVAILEVEIKALPRSGQ